MPSPTCTINGSASPQDVAASSTVVIALANPAGVGQWFLGVTGCDDSSVLATIRGSLVIDQVHKSATFTAPSGLGSAVILMSTVCDPAGVNESSLGFGYDTNGKLQKSYTTTIKVNVPTDAGTRVFVPNETTEQDSSFGWTSIHNKATRTTSIAISPVYVTSLSTKPATQTRQRLQVDGYSSTGDGGGGLFDWKSTETRAADGGTVLAVNATSIAAGSNGAVLPQATISVASTANLPASGTVTIVTSAGAQVVTYTGLGVGTITGCSGGTGTMSTGGFVAAPGRWCRVFSGGLDVRWFGADATATIDSAPAFNRALAAIAAFPSGGRPALHVPAGQYNWFSTVSSPAYVKWLGDGYSTTEIIYYGSGQGLVHGGVAGAQDVASKIEGISLVNGSSGTDAATFQNLQGVHVDKCAAVGWLGSGFSFVDTILSELSGSIVSTCGSATKAAVRVDSTKVNGAGTGAGSTTWTWRNNNVSNNPSAFAGLSVDRTGGVNIFGGTSEGNGAVPIVIASSAENANGCGNVQIGGGIDLEIGLVKGSPTTVAVASNGAVLPQATINVADTTGGGGYPTQGSITVVSSAGVQTIKYTGTTGTSFTGCTGGTGTLSTGGQVTNNARYIEIGYGLSGAANTNGVTIDNVTMVMDSASPPWMPFAVKVNRVNGFACKSSYVGVGALPGQTIANFWFEGTSCVGMSVGHGGLNFVTNVTDPLVMVNGIDQHANSHLPWVYAGSALATIALINGDNDSVALPLGFADAVVTGPTSSYALKGFATGTAVAGARQRIKFPIVAASTFTVKDSASSGGISILTGQGANAPFSPSASFNGFVWLDFEYDGTNWNVV